MEQYLDLALRFLNEFSTWSPPKLTLYTIVAFSAVSSWVLSRVVAAPPLFLVPVAFIILTISGMLSNFSSRGIALMGTGEIQRALIFTVIGHAVACVILLAVFKAGEKSSRK